MNIEIITLAIVGIGSLIIGHLLSSILFRKSIERKSQSILKDAKKVAEQIKKDKI